MTSLQLAEELAREVERLPRLAGKTLHEAPLAGVDLREAILLWLRSKVIPELRAPAGLPLAVGVQGGANTGKSTVFNALAGRILSPALVQASATRHPLALLHEKWRPTFLDRPLFTDLSCLELSDPEELISGSTRPELLYLQFHRDAELESLVLIDSPDFDSVVENNLQAARHITAFCDVVLFVTTQEKYLDRDLVQCLELAVGLKASVVLIFNKVAEEIVFETLLEDLRRSVPSLGEGAENLHAIRIPPSPSPHPEDDLRDRLRPVVLERLGLLEHSSVKRRILAATAERIVQATGELGRRLSPEIDFKARLLAHLRDELQRETAAYRDAFDLALPEETVALRRLIRLTEVGPAFELSGGLQGAGRGLNLLGATLRRFNDTSRRLLMRLAASYEGTLGDSPRALEEYARARDATDLDRVLRRAESLRAAVEVFLRRHEESSPLARETLRSFFTPERLAHFPGTVRHLFSEELPAAREAGESVASDVERWIARHRAARPALFVASNLLKVAGGLLLALAIPPAGVFSLLNWLYFAAGYFLASYLVALLLSLPVRRRRRFRQARVRNLERVLVRLLQEPLAAFLDGVIQADQVRSVEGLARKLREHRELCEARRWWR